MTQSNVNTNSLGEITRIIESQLYQLEGERIGYLKALYQLEEKKQTILLRELTDLTKYDKESSLEKTKFCLSQLKKSMQSLVSMILYEQALRFEKKYQKDYLFHGIITDENFRGIADFTVSLVDEKDAELSSGRTDNYGFYSIEVDNAVINGLNSQAKIFLQIYTKDRASLAVTKIPLFRQSRINTNYVRIPPKEPSQDKSLIDF